MTADRRDDDGPPPGAGDADVRVNRADGKVYVSWTEHGVRESVTIDEATGHVTDARGWPVNRSDARVLRLFLDASPLPGLSAVADRMWTLYRDRWEREPDVYAATGSGLVPDSIPDEMLLEMLAVPDRTGAYLYYDRRLRPIDSRTWGRLRERPGYLRVARTAVVDRLPPHVAVEISTVWLGIDHAMPGQPPIVFETMTFALTRAAHDVGEDQLCWRAPDEREARAVHEAQVRRLSASMQDPVVAHLPTRGRAREVKPLRGMGSRRRSGLWRFVPERSGTRRIRGRHGHPDRWVVWRFDAETGTYDVDNIPDPVLAPVPGGRKWHRRRRARRRGAGRR